MRALMGLMQTDAAAGDVYNIGGVEEISILDLAKRVIQATGSNSTIQLIPYEEAFQKDFEDMQRRVPSIEKIKSLIGFAPQTDLNSIIDAVVEYIKAS